MEPNLIAFLKVIRVCEGTDGPDGYFKTFNGGKAKDLSKHPNVSHTFQGKKTSPAGAYQIVYTTWEWLKTFVPLPNFHPPTQDIAAVQLLKYRRAYDLVLAGKFDQAIIKCRNEWTSLPGASQTAGKTMATVRSIYQNAGGRLA